MKFDFVRSSPDDRAPAGRTRPQCPPIRSRPRSARPPRSSRTADAGRWPGCRACFLPGARPDQPTQPLPVSIGVEALPVGIPRLDRHAQSPSAAAASTTDVVASTSAKSITAKAGRPGWRSSDDRHAGGGEPGGRRGRHDHRPEPCRAEGPRHPETGSAGIGRHQRTGRDAFAVVHGHPAGWQRARFDTPTPLGHLGQTGRAAAAWSRRAPAGPHRSAREPGRPEERCSAGANRHRSSGDSRGSSPAAMIRSARSSPLSTKSSACSPIVARWCRLLQSNTPFAPHVFRTPTPADTARSCSPGTARWRTTPGPARTRTHWWPRAPPRPFRQPVPSTCRRSRRVEGPCPRPAHPGPG